MSIKQEAISGVKWTSLLTVISTTIQVLRTLILARLLNPEDFGLMGMVMVVTGFAQIYSDMGISAAIIHRQDSTNDHLSSLYWLNIFSGFITFGLVWFSIPLVVKFFGEPRLLPLIQILALIFVITPLGAQFQILLQKELRFNMVVRREIMGGFIGFVVAVVLASNGFGVWSLVWGLIAEVSVKAILYMSIGLSQYRPSFHFKRHDLRDYIGFGLYQIGERTVNFLSQRLDQILIGYLLGANTLGFYNVAFNLTTLPIERINPIVTTVAFPVFSKIQNDNIKLRSNYIKVINLLTTINAPLLIGLCVTAPLFVPLFFGEKWYQSVIFVQILSFVALCRSIGNPIGSLQLAKGRADLGFKWNVILLFFSLPTIYIGGTLGNAKGVAYSLLILQVCLYVPSYLYLVRPLIGRCAKEYASSILKPITLAAFMGLMILPIPYIFKAFSNLILLIMQIGIGCLLYIFILWLKDKNVINEFRTILFSKPPLK